LARVLGSVAALDGQGEGEPIGGIDPLRIVAADRGAERVLGAAEITVAM
jgi:hypothetical protein